MSNVENGLKALVKTVTRIAAEYGPEFRITGADYVGGLISLSFGPDCDPMELMVLAADDRLFVPGHKIRISSHYNRLEWRPIKPGPVETGTFAGSHRPGGNPGRWWSAADEKNLRSKMDQKLDEMLIEWLKEQGEL